MGRLPNALVAALAAVAVAGGCADGGAAREGVTIRTGSHATSMLLHGKYQALGIAFPDRETGFAAIAGYPGTSTTLESWIERTADGGMHWLASRPVSGQHQPGAQVGLAFVSARQGWAYEPGLFFTRDGGVTWLAERTRLALVGPVAVARTSTWVVGYGCARGYCPATIYAAGRVGGPLRRLAGEPAGTVVTMQRPTTSVAWLLVAGRHGRLRLLTTSDAGGSWTARSYPCRGGAQLSAVGPRSLWLICSGTPEGPGLPGVLYRTTNGGHTWMRIARENSLSVYPVSNRVAWAVQSMPLSRVLRTTDGGRTWHAVLTRQNADVQSLAPQGLDGAQVVVRVFSANGVRFVAYRTRSGGRTWHHAALPG